MGAAILGAGMGSQSRLWSQGRGQRAGVRLSLAAFKRRGYELGWAADVITKPEEPL